MDITTLLISILTGGVGSAIYVQFSSSRTAKIERRRSILDEQLRELYAPLFYLVVQSEKLFELNKRVHDAFKVEFIDKQYSDNKLTQERVRLWVDSTLGVANDYVKLVERNNEKISALLDSKFAFIDPDDTELFLLFFEHRIRFITEQDDGGVLKIPLQVYEHIGEISYLRPEFIERVKSKFLNKKQELDKLSKK